MMKRIYNQDGVWYFDKYFAYLNKNIKKIPSNIQKIILDEEKYALNGENTLYDSKIIEFNYNEEHKKLTLVLLDAYFKRKYYYRFENVEAIIFSKSILSTNSYLLIHEFSISRKGAYKYRFLFDSGFEFSVYFSSLKINSSRKRRIKAYDILNL